MDYIICFDLRWLLYPLMAIGGAVFGIGLGTIIVDIHKRWHKRG